MKLSSVFIGALLLAGLCQINAEDWRAATVKPWPDLPRDAISKAQRSSLLADPAVNVTLHRECEAPIPVAGDPEGLLEFRRVSVGRMHVTHVYPGVACGRTKNDRGWLVTWQGDRAQVLSPVDGMIVRVLPSSSHGLHDVAAMWSVGAGEWGWARYRFDGKQYRPAGRMCVACGDADVRVSQ